VGFEDAQRTPLFSVAWHDRENAFDDFKINVKR
jgi:hypothetical protein